MSHGINRLTDAIANKLTGSKESLQGSLFYTLFIIAMSVYVLGTIATLAEGVGLMGIMPMIISFIIFLILLLVVRRTKKYEVCTFIGAIVIVAFAIPSSFFTSGGVESGIIIWMMLADVSVLFVLQGPKQLVGLASGIIVDVLCLIVSFIHPEVVTGMMDRKAKISDIAVALVFTIIGIAAFMKVQTTLIEKEREKNKKQNEKLEEALSTQQRFLANMSHEIRTPINTIIGLNEMTLRADDLPADIKENADNIQAASKMLLSLINDILDISKIDSGKMNIVPERYETVAVFTDIVNTNIVRAKEKRLAFNVSIDPEIPSMLFGDELRIKQVVNNLITNAVKYTEKGSVTVTFSCRKAKDDEKDIILEIAVADTGIGIKRDDMGRLFKSFERVDEGRTKGIEGTGLGLTLVKQFTTLMHGDVSVDSIYGKGSVFTVSIPQRIESEEKIGNVDLLTTHIRTSGTGRYKESFKAPEARVLVCDDNKMNLLVIKKLLRQTCVQVDCVSSGEESLKKTIARKYHVILMDHVMPDMDGVQTLKAIRDQDGPNKRTPVIALTANAMSGAAEKYMHLGFSNYLAKPVYPDLLEEMLLRYIPEDLIEEKNGKKQVLAYTINNGRRKQKIRITVDSACDLSKDELDDLNVGVDFHYVLMDNGRFQDNREIFARDLIAYLEKHPDAKAEASSPSVEEYESFFSDALMSAENVIHISLASGVSESYDAAYSAAKSFSHVNVFDSQKFCGGMAIPHVACKALFRRASPRQPPHYNVSYS
jgi:signal transduction histidine kinase/DNA-binding response OmpR family regulator